MIGHVRHKFRTSGHFVRWPGKNHFSACTNIKVKKNTHLRFLYFRSLWTVGFGNPSRFHFPVIT